MKRGACTACRSRKIKCDGSVPCDKCKDQSLCCEYATTSRKEKRKPRTRRGGIITQYKNGAKRYNSEFFRGYLPAYEEYIYPVFPIITTHELDQLIDEEGALVYALFAVTIGHAEQNTQDSAKLIDMALDKRGVLKPGSNGFSIHSVLTCAAISSSLVASNQVELAYFYLREAISIATIIKLHDPIDKPKELKGKMHRLYWMLYVHERFIAIHFRRPVLLSAVELPEYDNVIPWTVHQGFIQIIKLFQLVDEDFIKAYLGDTNVTQAWIEDKQHELSDISGVYSDLTEMQQADLIVTQQWLRMLLWQMAISRYWLNHQTKGCMSLLFPVEIAHQLRALFSSCSQTSIEVHGSSILRKLFELSISIADVITIMPASTCIDDYLWIANFLLNHPVVTQQQKEVLSEKLAKIHAGTPDSAHSPETVDAWLSLSTKKL